MILHRPPVAGGKPPVDVAYEPVDALFELVVPGNLHPAGHHHLDEHDAAPQLRMAFQRVAKRAQALGNSLAVIEPVQTQNQLAIGKSGTQLLRPPRDCLRVGAPLERVEVNPDWEIARANRAILEPDSLQVAPGCDLHVAHHAPHALYEIAKIAPGLETEQIELEQRAQEALLLRELGKNVVGRKG